MTESEARAKIVAEARSWLATPYHHCADVKGVGVDCGMLIVRVFVDAGLCPPFDPRPYSPQWHLHRSEEIYLGFIGDHCAEVIEPQQGDVVVFKYGRCYSHGGIVTQSSPLTLVHAYQPRGRVSEEPLSHNAKLSNPRHAPRFFDFWQRSA
jgi:cell wall-associated NlpC family hydrolase